jgi:hypothetical protein
MSGAQYKSFNPVNKMGIKFNPRYRNEVYRNGILLVLLLERQSLRQVQVKQRLEYVIGSIRKETFFANIRKLQLRGWIIRKKIDVIPKRVPKSRKLQKYRELYPVAFQLMTQESRRGINHVRGRYEIYLGINLRLPIDFVEKLKNRVAAFFGFGSWHNGLYCQDRHIQKLLLNVRNSFSRVRRDIIEEPNPRAEYKTEKRNNLTVWWDNGGGADDEPSKILTQESAFPHLIPQCLRRKRNRLCLQKNPTSKNSEVEDAKRTRSSLDWSVLGQKLRPVIADRTF